MKEPVVSAQGSDRIAAEHADSASGWKILFVVGIAIAVVGVVDIAMLFFPSRWASLDWEFGILSAIPQVLPLATIGMGLMSSAAVANGWMLSRRLMAILMLLASLLLLIVTVMYVLDVFAVLKVALPPMKPAIKLTAVRTCLMFFTYFVLYLALGVWTWRRLRATKGPRG